MLCVARHLADRCGNRTVESAVRRLACETSQPAPFINPSLRWLLAHWSIGLAVGLLASSAAVAAKRPNILWITSEDNAAHWLGCYGNRDAHTPRLDALAGQSLRFTHAFANAPVCSVARSTILSGVHAVTQGTQHMSSRYAIPADFKPYVSYLRELGYYCTNNAKTDYNRLGDDRSIWDSCSELAHYKDRKDDQPFFAVFNLNISHASSLASHVVADNRNRGKIPIAPRVNAASLTVPPCLPDLDQVREDIAIYHDVMTAMDAQVGNLLDELELEGLAKETIVIYCSDHGGPTPRGKRYLTDTGVRVPLLVRFSETWQHLSPFPAGEPVSELVSFVDLAPTLLSLAGLKRPEHMQGRAFLGKHRRAPDEDPFVFLYADRFDELVGMRRGITDGRFKYIRRFTPHLAAAPYSYSALWIPSWLQWQTAWRRKLLFGYHKRLWESPQPIEELFDTSSDPWEMRNLANDVDHVELLTRMRTRLRETMVAACDTGLIPEAMFADLVGEQLLYEYVRSSRVDLEAVLEFALLATTGDVANLPELVAALSDVDPLLRYWGTMGCLILGPDAGPATEKLKNLLADEHSAIRVTSAHALHRLGQTEIASTALVAEYGKQISDPAQILLNHVATLTDNIDAIPQSWIRQTLSSTKVNEYVDRFANRLQDIRANRTHNVRW